MGLERAWGRRAPATSCKTIQSWQRRRLPSSRGRYQAGRRLQVPQGVLRLTRKALHLSHLFVSYPGCLGIHLPRPTNHQGNPQNRRGRHNCNRDHQRTDRTAHRDQAQKDLSYSRGCSCSSDIGSCPPNSRRYQLGGIVRFPACSSGRGSSIGRSPCRTRGR